MIFKTESKKFESYITKDGSIIRGIMHPSIHGNRTEATVPAGGKTLIHNHQITEEIYHIIEGSGIMTLGFEEFEVRKGNSICIVPRTPHRIQNTGKEPLKILCCCASAYAHEDMELLE
jgi:mannose-6-phosphate isomerase-like protein (cupin superfamily)